MVHAHVSETRVGPKYGRAVIVDHAGVTVPNIDEDAGLCSTLPLAKPAAGFAAGQIGATTPAL